MAAGEERREVPDSEDEPMTSSPISVSDGAADKLFAAAPVPLQDAQHALQEAARHHQANAEHPDGRTDGLDADQEIASVDVDATNSAQTDVHPSTAASRNHQEHEACSDQADFASVGALSNDRPDVDDIVSSANAIAMSMEQHDRQKATHDVIEGPEHDATPAIDPNADDRGALPAREQQADFEPQDIALDLTARDPCAKLKHETSHTFDTKQVQYSTGSPVLDALDSSGIKLVEQKQEDLTRSNSTSHDTNNTDHDAGTRSSRSGNETAFIDHGMNDKETSVAKSSMTRGSDDVMSDECTHNSRQLVEHAVQEENSTPTSTAIASEASPASTEPATSRTDAEHHKSISSQEPLVAKTPQEITLAELKAQKAALLASLATLPAIQILMEESAETIDGDDEPTESEIVAAANKIVKDHIKLLHEYNELKDVGQGLMGLIADQRGVRIVEVQEEFGVDAND
ncbi:Swi5-domain-containing protein [Paraphoma chrysanthemicola]|uniref:Swi5-domain-containing protein n=1 Tax=Paraphoma chrysanthemicola TaxID=798071 RepID=A0A8K0R642_9PLEO|nr:Swi5-domain-containing protein [Paraphoma chrysanthemicola]